jgi:hypothetical protein
MGVGRTRIHSFRNVKGIDVPFKGDSVKTGEASLGRPTLRFLRSLNPFRPAGVALVFALCLMTSLDATRLLEWDNRADTLARLKDHAQNAIELESGVAQVEAMIARDYPNPGPLAKPVTITAATADPVETLLTAAYRLITFSTLDPIRNSATACLDDGDESLAQASMAAASADQAGRCNVALLIPVKRWIAQGFREGESLAFTLRHELGHAIFLGQDGAMSSQLEQFAPEKGELLHSVLIESEADVYALLKTAQRNGSWSSEAMLDGLIKFRHVQPRDSHGASIGTHDTTDALASVDANRQWLADAVGASDAAIVRQAEQIAIAGFKAYAARNGVVISERLNRILGARQASLASPTLDPSLGKLSVSVDRAPLYAAVFGSDGDELSLMGHHPLVGILLWSILWVLWLRAGWLSVEFMLKEITHGGSDRALPSTRFTGSYPLIMSNPRPESTTAAFQGMTS